MYGKRGKNSPNYKRKHTVEECKRISKNRQYKYGKENHCYGRKKMILPNSTKGILVKPEDIQKYLDLGYTFSAYSSYKNSWHVLYKYMFKSNLIFDVLKNILKDKSI